MNILIVGNGFDLSHYLPTKYDHFIDVMRAIEEKDTGQKIKDLSIYKVDEWMIKIDKMFEKKADFELPDYAMNFDELFSKTRESYFVEKTKEFYLTDIIKLSSKDVLKLQYRLEVNSWYQFFKNHVEEIKTWIDFEQKIEEVIYSISNVISFIAESNEANKFRFPYTKFNEAISSRTLGVLKFFKVFEEQGAYKSFNALFCNGEDIKNGFSLASLLEYVQKQLEDFIKIFDLYLELIISQLIPNSLFGIDSRDWIYPDKIFSFNYTNTFQRIHDSVEVEYLHGSHGEFQNIVLGISDLEDEALKKLKAYGFTKYHQKLFKDTDYLFLDTYKSKINDHNKKMEVFEKEFTESEKKSHRESYLLSGHLNLKFTIWGHSLDVSDKDYIIDLFSLNDDIDRNVRVTVFYFDKPAKFSLLNNLLAILGKDKVEQWMKNKWLVFKPNPEVKFITQEKSDVDEAS